MLHLLCSHQTKQHYYFFLNLCKCSEFSLVAWVWRGIKVRPVVSGSDIWCVNTLPALWDSYEMNISLQIWCLLMAWYLCIWTDRCPDSTRPETVRPCLLLCKKDCIVTPFSEWTRCPTACQPGKPLKREQNFGQTVTFIATGNGMIRGVRSWEAPRHMTSAFTSELLLGFGSFLVCRISSQLYFLAAEAVNKPWAFQAETGGCQCRQHQFGKCKHQWAGIHKWVERQKRSGETQTLLFPTVDFPSPCTSYGCLQEGHKGI